MTPSQAKQIAEQYLSWLGASKPHAAAKLEAMIEDALEGQWKPIDTAPNGKPIWVANPFSVHGTGEMEPCWGFPGRWKNIYTLKEIEWEPTHWRLLPLAPPNSKD